MVKIIMHGCNGAMGQVITKLAAEDKDAEITAGIDRVDNRENPYPVFTSCDACDVEADVIVDFSVAQAVDGVLAYALKRKMPLVLCTTGLSEKQLEDVKTASAQIPILRSANMSLGVNTVFKLAAAAAKILGEAGYDIEIVEKHHRLKLDAPSGTALALADSMNEALGNAYHYTYDRSDRREERDPKEIGISAVRGGNIVGEHEVIFAGTDEVIEFKHTAYSKAVFGKGAVQAAKFLAGREPGLYDMQDVIAANA